MVRTRKKKQAPKGSTRAKGDILEEIVAEMHEVEGISVERNVFLPVHNKGKRTREIDVLITSQAAGIPVRIAIECKNEIEKTGVEKIDAFVGKLKDVNLPTQLSVYVSKSGYTKGAIDRANQEGIKTLIFEDLSKSLTGMVIQSFQSTTYPLLAITNIQIRNNIAHGEAVSGGDLLFFTDKKGKVCGSIPDLVWQKWITGKIPSTLGDGKLKLKAPPSWKQIIRGQQVKIKEITISYRVTGFGMSIPGAVTQYNLMDASDLTLHKQQVTAKFLPPPEKLLLSQLDSEDDLNKFEKAKGPINIANRVRTPRIRWLAMYWPPSKSTLIKLNQLRQIAHQKGNIFDLNSISLSSIEGDSLSKLWEPIVDDHPILIQIRKNQQSK